MKLELKDAIRLVTGRGMWHTDSCGGKLPSLHLSDGPHGLRKQEEKVRQNNNSKAATCFPTASAVACSFDPALVAEMAQAIAREAWNEDISVLLGPGVNHKRSPLCGRNFEYFSEDPFLSGALGEAYVKAVQKEGIAVSLKHFAGNNQETHRQTANSQIDERALREIYLLAFEHIVKKAKPATVMASYNRLNGKYACENRRLLTEILREEWGFDGVIISDWGACADLPGSLWAGMDLEMPDSRGHHRKKLVRALKKREISQEMILQAAGRIQKLAERYAVPYRKKKEKWDISGHHDLARKIACQSAVLLKNDGVLPLKKGEKLKIAVIGELAEKMRFQGGGSSHINTMPVRSAAEILKEYNENISYAAGYDSRTEKELPELEKEAEELAKDSDLVLFFGGLTDRTEGEGYDRKTLEMPENQKKLLEKLYRVNKNIVFVSFGGAPYRIACADRMRAILHMYLAGEAAGEACVQLLYGEENPCGKLAETFPLSVDDTPCRNTFATGSDDVEYRESIFTGYRYYDCYRIPVCYPFGFGLSYTAFAYSDLKLEKDLFTGEEMKVSFTITNTGNRKGAETAQIYVKNPTGCHYLRAEKELKGFIKAELLPGESKQVSVSLDEGSFSVYDEKMQKFLMPSGEYQILVAASSQDVRLSASLAVKGVSYERDDRELVFEYFDPAVRIQEISHKQFLRLYGRETSHFDRAEPGSYTMYHSLRQLSERSGMSRGFLKLAEKAVGILFPGKPADDPEVMMMLEGIRDGTIDCVSCQSGGVLPYRLAEAIVLSANGKKGRAVCKLLFG